MSGLEVVIDLQNLVASAKRHRRVGASVGIARREVSGARLGSRRASSLEGGTRRKSGWLLGGANMNVIGFFSRNRRHNGCRIGRRVGGRSSGMIFSGATVIQGKLLHSIGDVPLGGWIPLDGDVWIESDPSLFWQPVAEGSLVCSRRCCHVGTLHVNWDGEVNVRSA